MHSHIMLPETFGKAGKYGPEVFVRDGQMVLRVGEQESQIKLDPQRAKQAESDPRAALSTFAGGPAVRIAEMDANDIDIMGVSVSPLFYLYWAELDIAAEFIKLQNDALAAYCRHNPDRLFFMPTLPLQDIPAAVEEFERAVALGGRAINLAGGAIAGRELDDEVFWPLYEKAVEYDVPLFVHPYPEHLARASADRYNLSWVVGYLAQETTAFVRLLYGGVLDAFPALKICITHGGGFVPYQLGRIDRLAPYMPGVQMQKKTEDYLGNFYFETLVHDPRARKFMLEIIGADNLFYGSNYGSPHDLATTAFIDELGLDTATRDKIVGGNAERLFKLGAAASSKANSG
ncbi:amidohydrolase family protein [Mycobacterium vicinigordonae]|uniref:Amidohydrolase n=1 Tax=Mycobacterium vicinigordonae TaxID=1719132 RepID=A0A7D6I749_9MYCO|nr:amidohydrolase family protein [Mycobacterium vicinigordonae]QLL06237.1 amidohydrolase [Mycobacterium vicinigordonae]